jgi:hypothetical protein
LKRDLEQWFQAYLHTTEETKVELRAEYLAKLGAFKSRAGVVQIDGLRGVGHATTAEWNLLPPPNYLGLPLAA